MSASSFSSSTAVAPVAAASQVNDGSTALHPALLSLRAILAAADHLQAGLLSSTPTSTVQSAATLASSFFLHDKYEQDWEVLRTQLRLLVDYTHPDNNGASSPSGGVLEDGRAALLSFSTPRALLVLFESQDAADHAPAQGGIAEVTRLFLFLHRLTAAVQLATTLPTATATTAATSSSSLSSLSCIDSPVKTKAQLQVEDVAEPVLIYACAVASNLASYAAEQRRVRAAQLKKQSKSETQSTENINNAEGAKGAAEDALSDLGTIIWKFVLSVVQLYRLEKRVLHFLLSVLANLVTWPRLQIDTDACVLLYQLISPYYGSYSMVGAWMTMMCNITAMHATVSVPVLLHLGAVADIERLSLAVPPSESATTERLVTHAVQLLSNIAMHVFKG